MSVTISGTTGITTPGLDSSAMPTSEGSEIIASGGNSDGEWVKLADGNQICRFVQETTERSTSTTVGNLFYFTGTTVNYPLPFISTPEVTPAPRHTGGSLIWGYSRNEDATSLVLGLLSYGSSGTGYVGYVAFGRWK